MTTKKMTPKQTLKAEAESMGLETGGTMAELKARITGAAPKPGMVRDGKEKLHQYGTAGTRSATSAKITMSVDALEKIVLMARARGRETASMWAKPQHNGTVAYRAVSKFAN